MRLAGFPFLGKHYCRIIKILSRILMLRLTQLLDLGLPILVRIVEVAEAEEPLLVIPGNMIADS